MLRSADVCVDGNANNTKIDRFTPCAIHNIKAVSMRRERFYIAVSQLASYRRNCTRLHGQFAEYHSSLHWPLSHSAQSPSTVVLRCKMRPLPASVALLSTLVVLSTAQSNGKLRDRVVAQCVTQIGVNYIACTCNYVLQLNLVLPV